MFGSHFAVASTRRDVIPSDRDEMVGMATYDSAISWSTCLVECACQPSVPEQR
jgi:hypothetical protein